MGDDFGGGGLGDASDVEHQVVAGGVVGGDAEELAVEGDAGVFQIFGVGAGFVGGEHFALGHGVNADGHRGEKADMDDAGGVGEDHIAAPPDDDDVAAGCQFLDDGGGGFNEGAVVDGGGGGIGDEFGVGFGGQHFDAAPEVGFGAGAGHCGAFQHALHKAGYPFAERHDALFLLDEAADGGTDEAGGFGEYVAVNIVEAHILRHQVADFQRAAADDAVDGDDGHSRFSRAGRGRPVG